MIGSIVRKFGVLSLHSIDEWNYSGVIGTTTQTHHSRLSSILRIASPLNP